jgi:hypothetical protein
MARRERNMRIISRDGPRCKRCGHPTEVREHVRISERELAQPFYYSRWFKCANKRCATTLIMPAEFIVRNDGARDGGMAP